VSPGLGRGGTRFANAARVAAVVAALIAVLYAAVTVPFDIVDARHLVAQVDARLAASLRDVKSHGARLSEVNRHLIEGKDIDDAPLLLWRADARGTTVALSASAPSLTPADWSRSGRPTTVTIGPDRFRLLATRVRGGGWVVAGQSLAATRHVESTLARAELVAGPLLVVAMFFGALAIGLMASRPVEAARRRQLEFTADASHELRTPLTVIEAEVDLALGADREAASYKGTLERIRTEGKRLRRIVEDLLFLARFDSEPPAPAREPVDVATLAEACAGRFVAVAKARGISLTVSREGADAMLIEAPASWVDRLCGVLVDNACRYAGDGGSVRVIVTARGSTVSLAVEDSGPGIPPDERPFLFDRFHRGTEGGDGAGLGLAIADAVVRYTGGRWRVTNTPAGGAHMEISWRSVSPRGSVKVQGLRQPGPHLLHEQHS
jgi:signal transduction histidine kinase